ncbi:nucleoside phosphorylase [Trueperella sp. LYQ143]|uniref:nucleoside phosphorylase n=1 Tax=Trueperella sp. LYQ143 TaxID=3391059 RepID=UPI003983AE56
MELVRTKADEVLPLTRVITKDLRPRVLVVGDPARAQRVASMLDDMQELAKNREYWSFNGSWNGVPITVISHGVGACGAAAVFEEVCRGGAQLVIRSGTAGGLQDDVVDGDIVVATAAVRADGLSQRIVPLEYPAVSDTHVAVELERQARKSGLAVHFGVLATMASFYPSPVLPNEQVLWRDAGAVGVEMEVAALFTICGLHRVRAGALVAIDGNPLKDNDEAMTDYQPDRQIVDRAVQSALQAALDTLVTVEL